MKKKSETGEHKKQAEKDAVKTPAKKLDEAHQYEMCYGDVHDEEPHPEHVAPQHSRLKGESVDEDGD